MKTTLVILILLMVGCGTVGNLFLKDPDVTPEQKHAYVQFKDTLDATQKAYKPYHFAAIGFMVAGGLMIAYGAFVPTTQKVMAIVGVCFLATGATISAWAQFAPSHPKLIAAMIVSIVGAGIAFAGVRAWNFRHKGGIPKA